MKSDFSYLTNRNIKTKATRGFWGIFVLLLLVFSSAAYFFQANSTAVLGYEIKSYEEGISRLKAENQKNRIIVAENSSFKKIGKAEEIQRLNFLRISDNQFLSILPSSLARR